MPADIPDGQINRLLSYLVLRAADDGQETVGRVRLTKLLYLTEVEYFRAYRRRLTDLSWRFYHYGPYVMSIEKRFASLQFTEANDAESGLKGWHISPWQIGELDQLEGALPERAQRVADAVSKRWATEKLGRLLDYVYFETEPMLDAKRGDTLDFTGVEPSEPRIRPAQSVSPQLHARLAGIRSPFDLDDSVPVESRAPAPDDNDPNWGRLSLPRVTRAINGR